MLGDRLKELREDEGLTQNEFADIIGISRQSLSSYENNKNEPNLEVLIKICDYFSISIDYLTNRTKNKINPNLYKKEINDALYQISKIVIKLGNKKD